MNFALAGNQNCGKTTLFNTLTDLKRKTGNYPGVTVESVTGIVKGKENIFITDLPGVYSLRPFSAEEKVTRDFFLKQNPDCIINIVDATNLERNLYLTLQLIELNIPTVMALNMMDEAERNGSVIDVANISRMIGVPVIPICAVNGYGVDKLLKAAEDTAYGKLLPRHINRVLNANFENCIKQVKNIILPYARERFLPVDFAVMHIIDCDKDTENKLFLKKYDKQRIDKIISDYEREVGYDRNTIVAQMRYNYAEKVCRDCVIAGKNNIGNKSGRIADNILTGKYTAYAALAFVMLGVFYITFKAGGGFLTRIIEKQIYEFNLLAANFLDKINVHCMVKSLICDGIIAGVGSVLSFVPIIGILFLLLSVLEDTGYMARVAFIADKPLKKIGLSGRSIISLLIGFGCTVPAVMSARTLPSERDRKTTIFLTPFMSCSAKIPIYTVFCTAFFRGFNHIAIVLLYTVGIILGIIYALAANHIFYAKQTNPFVLELPNYRLPSPKNVLSVVLKKCGDFIQKAYTIILLSSVVIWFLQNFDIHLNYIRYGDNSILAYLGELLSPLFAPLGFGNGFAASSLICGITAKEAVISTLCIMAGVSKQGLNYTLMKYFTPLSAASFLVFTLLYTPCMAAVAAVRKELSSTKLAAFYSIVQCVIAWLASYAVYNIGLKLCVLFNI